VIKLRIIKQVALDSLAVRWWCESPWSHVEFCTPEGFYSARPDGGVKLRPFNYCRPARIAIGSIGCNSQIGEKVMEFAHAQDYKGYDWLAIAAFVFHTHWQQKNTWDCSQLVDASFQYANYPILSPDIKPSVVEPATIYASPKISWQEVNVKNDPYGLTAIGRS
jgi:hypothetical protein